MGYVLVMFPPNRIREIRLALGLSQAGLGERVGLSGGQVSHLENGARNLTHEWMRRISRALGVTPADLLIDADNPDRLSEEERAVIAAMRQADRQTRDHIGPVASALVDSPPASSRTGND